MAKKLVMLSEKEIEELPGLLQSVYCVASGGETGTKGDNFAVTAQVFVQVRATLDVIKDRTGISASRQVNSILCDHLDEYVKGIEAMGGKVGDGLKKAITKRIAELRETGGEEG